MSDTTSGSHAQNGPDGVLAAEYVLHLLSPADRRAVEERISASGRFRAMVATWQEDFVRLTDAIAEVEPPARIRERLVAFAASEPGRPVADRPARRLSPLRLGAGLAAGLLAASVAALAVLGVAPPAERPGAIASVYTAAITGEDSDFDVAARFDPAESALVLRRIAAPGRAGRSQQLWLLPEGATAPISLGVLPPGETVTVALPAEVAASVPGGLLEISEEPPGGSPEASPTGPVLGLGRVEGP